MPAVVELAMSYPRAYYGSGRAKFRGFVEQARRLAAAWRARRLSRLVPQGARVLDIGCGPGYLLAGLARRGLECIGTEISDHAAARARQLPGVRIEVGELTDLCFPTGHFDLIVLWQVLEHLADVNRTFQEVRRIVRSGGLVVISTPNVTSVQAAIAREKWLHLDPPRHTVLLTAAALERLCAQHELRVERVSYWNFEQNVTGFLEAVLSRLGLEKNAFYHALQRGLSEHDRSSRTRRACVLMGGLILAAPVLAASAAASVAGAAGTIEAHMRAVHGE